MTWALGGSMRVPGPAARVQPHGGAMVPVMRTRSQATSAASAPVVIAADADDAALVAAAVAGNGQAFTLLYRRYLQPIHRYCSLRLGSREAAEDASGGGFLKALAGPGAE